MFQSTSNFFLHMFIFFIFLIYLVLPYLRPYKINRSLLCKKIAFKPLILFFFRLLFTKIIWYNIWSKIFYNIIDSSSLSPIRCIISWYYMIPIIAKKNYFLTHCLLWQPYFSFYRSVFSLDNFEQCVWLLYNISISPLDVVKSFSTLWEI